MPRASESGTEIVLHKRVSEKHLLPMVAHSPFKTSSSAISRVNKARRAPEEEGGERRGEGANNLIYYKKRKPPELAR